MLSLKLKSVSDVAEEIALKIKTERLKQNLTQKGLALRSGVSLGSMKRFENKYEISLQSLIKISFALDMQDSFDDLFKKTETPNSIDEITQPKKSKKRGTDNG